MPERPFTSDRQRGKTVVRLAWFSADEYARLQKNAAARKAFTDDYETWHAAARKTVIKHVSSGDRVIKVSVEGDAFADWCKTNDKTLDQESLEQFAQLPPVA